MSKETIITSYSQLLTYIKENDLSSEAICTLLIEAIQVIADSEKSREQLIQEFEEFVDRYGKGEGEKPIFLGMDLDVKHPQK